MFDFRIAIPGNLKDDRVDALRSGDFVGDRRYRAMKRAFDLVLCVPLLVAFSVSALALAIMNPFMNKGSLFYVQRRMGRGCEPFRAYKFRSMISATGEGRGAFDPLDSDRITPLGRWMRKTRVDELPQVINVLRGEMSLIGPRPDSYDHALIYVETIPGYRARCQALPGISGYAQVKVGYVDGRDGIVKKVRADLAYIRSARFSVDLWIAWRTILTILGREGA